MSITLYVININIPYCIVIPRYKDMLGYALENFVQTSLILWT